MFRLFRFLSYLSLLAGFHSTVQADHIIVTDFWVSEAPPVARVHAAYLTIANLSDHKIVLESIESPAYARIEMHKSLMVNDKMQMESYSQIVVPANTRFHFQPGGFHLMLLGPKNSWRAGDIIDFTFHFDGQLQFSLSAPVRKRESMQK